MEQGHKGSETPTAREVGVGRKDSPKRDGGRIGHGEAEQAQQQFWVQKRYTRTVGSDKG